MKQLVILSTSSSLKEVWERELKGDYQLSFFHDFKTLTNFLGNSGSLPLAILHYDRDYDYFYESLEELLKKYPLKMLILASVPKYEEGSELFKLRINGYTNARIDTELLKQVLEVVDSGNVWVYPDFMSKLISNTRTNEAHTPDLDSLSEREKEVALLIAEGLHNHEIALQCNISERTVKAHLTSIFTKLVTIHPPIKVS